MFEGVNAVAAITALNQLCSNEDNLAIDLIIEWLSVDNCSVPSGLNWWHGNLSECYPFLRCEYD